MPAAALAKMSAGLSRINLDRILTEAVERGVKITPELLKEKKKEIIQAECHGLLEFIEPAHTLDAVAGHARAKEMLRQAASALKKGRIEVLPMGYLISGPVGTGKTFLVTCFAGDIGIPCVKFLNFRSQWQGVTEANLEKIFNLLKALWPVAVMVDEADAFLGNRDASGRLGDQQPGVRLHRLASWATPSTAGRSSGSCSPPGPTCCPVDLKRQGRAEEHLALFYPQSDAERDELFKVVAAEDEGEAGAALVRRAAPEGRPDCRGADIEAVLVRSKFRALAEGREEPTEADVAGGGRPTSSPPPIRWRSSCRTWPRCRSAPAARCSPRLTGRWSGTPSPAASGS